MTTRFRLEVYVQQVDQRGWDYGEWDSDEWAEPVVWTDVSDDCQGVYLSGGRVTPLDRYRAARLEVRMDNRAGVYSSWSDKTPFAPPGTRHLGAGTIVRFALELEGGAVVPLFSGTASTWLHRAEGPDLWVELGADDVMALLPAANAPAQTDQGQGETAGPRLERILMANALTGIPTRFDPGVVPLQSTTLAADAATLTALTADSDGGWLWVDGAGTMVYYQADRDTTDPRWLDPVVTFTDQEGNPPGAICWEVAELDDTAETVVNQVDISRAGGAAVVVTDLGSRSRYGPRTFQRHDLIYTADTQSTTLATKLLARLAPGGPRPARVTATARDDATAAALAGLQWHDRVRLIVHDPNDYVAMDAFVDTYTWRVAPLGADRACVAALELALSPAVTFLPAGRWDTGLWDTDEWGY